jgi:hypothetical protein
VVTPELRFLDDDGQLHAESAIHYGAGEQQQRSNHGNERQRRRQGGRQQWDNDRGPGANGHGNGRHHAEPVLEWRNGATLDEDEVEEFVTAEPQAPARKLVRIYPYGVGQNRLRSAATTLNVPIQIVDDLNQADVVLTLKNYYRQQPQPIADAERRNIPIYVLRSNTVAQMEQCLVDIFHIPSDPIDLFSEAMREAQQGIQQVLNGASDFELSPQSAAIRSQQHQLVRAANLVSHSYGREPYRRVRIFRK